MSQVVFGVVISQVGTVPLLTWGGDIFVSEESPIHSQFITTCFIRIAPQSSDKHVDRNTGATSFTNQFCHTEMKIGKV